MDPERASAPSIMEKIRIVMEHNQLADSEKEAYLKKEGIDRKIFELYQQEIASNLGIDSINKEPVAKKSRCEELIEQLCSSNDEVRRDAARELGRKPRESAEAINTLIERMLNDDADFVRNWSSWALAKIEPQHPDVVEGFLHIIENEKHGETVRNWSVVGISASKTDYVQDRLIEILNTGESFARISAIEAMHRIGSTSSQFVTALEEASNSLDEILRTEALNTLSRLRLEI